MARLSHPQVVAVYDVEQTEHGLALAMELVRGTDLRTWLRERDRDVAEILEMFVAAGTGLAAAHEAGMRHRDFKPGNVLVGARPDTDAWVVKVTDFGLAQLRGPPTAPRDVASVRSSSSHDELTQAGTVLGTPRYMSPEQHAGAELTAAADQYSFCVALWEALAFEPPFTGSPSRMAVAKRRGPPAWPKVADVPAFVVEALRRGLAPTPADRWPTLRALLTALTPRRRLRAGVFAGAIAAVGALAIAVAWVMGGRPDAGTERCRGGGQLIADVWAPPRAGQLVAALRSTEAPYADAVADRARARLDGWAAAWLLEHRQACEATSVRHEQSEVALDLRMRCLDRARRGLDTRVATLMSVDASTIDRVHDVLRDLPSIDRCRRVELLSGEGSRPNDADAPAVAAAYEQLDRARAVGKLGRTEAALAEARAAADQARALGYRPLAAQVGHVMGELLTEAGQLEEAEAMLSRGLTDALATGQWSLAFESTIALMYTVGHKQQRPATGLVLADAARGLHQLAGGQPENALHLHNALGVLHSTAGDPAAAEAEYRRAIQAWGAAPHAEDGLLVVLANLGGVLRELGKTDEALELAEQTVTRSRAAFGPDHPHVLRAMHSLGSIQLSAGQGAEATRTYSSALGAAGRTWGAGHPDTAEMRTNYAAVLNAVGRHEEAQTQARAALEVLSERLGPKHATTALARSALATALVYGGEPAAAREHYVAALEVWSEQLGDEHPRVLSTRFNFGALLHDLEDDEAARAQLQLALDGMLALYGPDHSHVAAARMAMAAVTRRLGDLDTTRELLEAALASRQRTLDPRHPELAAAQLQWGEYLLATGDAAAAIEPLQEAWKTLRSRPALADHRAGAAYLLALALDETGGDLDRARELAAAAEDAFAKLGPGSSASTDEVRALRRRLAAK